MNLCEGRVGRQETTAAVWIVCVMCSIFAVNTQETFSGGNASYAATLFAAAAALGIFSLVAAAMRARRCGTLMALYRRALGAAGGFALSLVTALMLVVVAAVPLSRLMAILCRYIFVDADAGQIALYFLPVVATLTLMGLETVTRTSRLFAVVILLSLLAVLIIAIPAYETFRLYPLLGGSAKRLALQSLDDTSWFLPALLALLICGRGVQGIKNASRAAVIAVCAAAALTTLVQLLTGMAYSHETLATSHAPMYRLTAAVRSGGAYLRTDKLLLFFWLIGGLVGAAFLSYAASLLYTRAAGLNDVRPAAAAFSVAVCVLTLLAETAGEKAQRVAAFFDVWGWALLAGPPLIAAVIAMLKKEKAV